MLLVAAVAAGTPVAVTTPADVGFNTVVTVVGTPPLSDVVIDVLSRPDAPACAEDCAEDGDNEDDRDSCQSC